MRVSAASPRPGLGFVLPAGTITSGTLGSGAAVTGWAAAAIPVVGLAVTGVTLALSLLANRKGPRQKVATTHIVDQVEPELQRNLDGYRNGPRTRSSQAQALANFDAGWQYVLDNCGAYEMGEPGRRCISERQAGGRWDWFALYRDPIANDTPVPDPVFSGQGLVNQLVDDANRQGFAWLPLAVGGLILFLAVAK